MSNIFAFGEQVAEYDVSVFNEREVRAGAGILFFGAVLSSMNAFYTGNLTIMKWFITVFLIDFIIRVLINPRFSPSMILGRFAVSNQVPEYSGAVQKRFAWALALAIALTMFILVVVLDMRGPFLMITCMLCLTLMFFETAFGICIGCKMYNLMMKEQATLCPGGACAVKRKHDIQHISMAQFVIVTTFILGMILVPLINGGFGSSSAEAQVESSANNNNPQNNAVHVAPPVTSEQTDCDIPKMVSWIGHEEEYRAHHGCK